jgi:hypothetical protein
VNVIDHQITLVKDTGEQVIVEENTPFKISTFSLIEI